MRKLFAAAVVLTFAAGSLCFAQSIESLSTNFDGDMAPWEDWNGATSDTGARAGWVRIYCNIHPAMAANIIVLNNSYFAQTDEEGRYAIPDVPDGEYTLRVWHEFGGTFDREIRVGDSRVHHVNILIREDRKLLPHRDKFGNRYRSKY